jgi:glycerol kinase
MSREAVLALDLGTTSVRALVVRADGRVAARAQRPLGVAFPAPGRVEQDPREMEAKSVLVLREALAAARLGAGDVAGLGLVTQRATAIAWHAGSGEPLAPALGWQDQRTAARVGWFRERGIPMTTLASATKLEWWLREEPAIARAAAEGTLRFGTPDAWLGFRLSGGAASVTDPGNAACTALYDAAAGAWSAPLCALFGVDPKALPAIAPTSAVVGETPRALLGAPVPLAARAGDQQAATFAQGAHARGDAKLTLGTSAMLDLHTGGEPIAPPPGAYPLPLWRLGDGPTDFCVEGTVITAGAALDWLVALGIAADVGALDALARSAPTSAGVVFVPALQGLGTPFLDDSARGLVGGMTRGTDRAALARAAFEGVAQRCADVCEGLSVPSGPLRVDGGLARSDFAVQTIANFAGRPLWRAAETETTALGAAFLAGLATGVWSDPAACMRVVAPPVRFEPALGASERGAARARWQAVVARARGA